MVIRGSKNRRGSGKGGSCQERASVQEFWNRPVTRRKFLKWQVAGGAAAFTGLGLGMPVLCRGDGVPDLAVVKGGPGPAVRAAVNTLGGMSAFVRPGQKVVIKPNMSFDLPPESGTNTNPEVIQSLAAMCREVGAGEIYILDNPLRDAEMCLERSGIRAAGEEVEQCRVEGLKSSNRFREISIPEGREIRSTEVMKEVLDADVIIAAPVAKHHSSTGVSLSLKGMMGLILNRGVLHWRYDLHKAIVDLGTVLRADLTVIDVTRALTTNGPSGPGKVVRMDRVVASADMVAADAQVVSMVKWYGRSIEPRQIPHIKEAHKRGLGRMDIENLTIKEIAV